MFRRHLLARCARSPIVIAVILAAITTASAGGYAWVHVHRGDTLSEIAKKRHTTVSELVALNHLPGNGDLIIAGTKLKVPRHHHRADHRAHHHRAHHHRAHHHRAHDHRARHHHAHSAARRAVHRVVGRYTVRSGDSLDAIAARWHVPPQRIARANQLPSSLIVRIGQILRIPHWVHGPGHKARRAHHRAKHPARRHRHHVHHHRAHHHHRARNSVPSRISAKVAKDRAWLARRHVPSREGVARLIRRTAASFHVPLNFALAVSWQESGFNQRAVSPVGAIGAMQVVPSSGRFVSTYVVHRRLHLLNAHDNVVAGVGLLSVLLSDTRGNQRVAAAGYYQGLASVRANGFFRDTKRYVADVLELRSRFG